MTEIKALENVFAAEIENRLPFQSKANIYKKLQEQSLLIEMTINVSGVQVTGYQLTHAGRFKYCSNCK